MTKKERKELEEKMIVAITETVKLHGLKSTATFLKSVKKHSKVIAKKLMKELADKANPPAVSANSAKRGVTKKSVKSSNLKAPASKKSPSLRRKSNA
ncbi:MAG: hypothetical protein IPP32_09235 [Bacteroidetes bacterium]|nr:hypothetical protein [Bacteroidota bacterium]